MVLIQTVGPVKSPPFLLHINTADLQINLLAEYIFERQACYKKMLCFQKSFHPIMIRKEDFDPSTEYRITRAACID